MPYIGQIPSTGENNNFKILDDILSYTETFNGSSSGVVSVADDTLTFVSHRFITGQRITYSTTGTAIGGLVISTAYFVIKNDQNTIKLASTFANANNNVAINLTALGTGTTHTLIVAFDSINTKFKATYDNGTKALITRAGQLQISINGVIQQPQDTTSPTNGFGIDLDGVIIFSTAPANTDIFWGNVFANNFATFDISDNTVDSFTGNGSLVNFTLSKIPANNQNILVTIDGVVQYPSDATNVRAYSLSENILTFVGAPGNATAIQVRHIGFAGATSSSVTGFYGRTGNVGLTTADTVSIGAATIGTGGIGTSLLVQGNARITGILTVGTGSITIDGVNNTISGVINTNATGVSTVGSLSIGNTSVISSARQLQNIASLDATTTATIESAVANAPNTFTDLSVSGVSTFVNGPVLIGSGTSTGTAGQVLQATGGAYVSGNLGIGTTNPTTKLDVFVNGGEGLPSVVTGERMRVISNDIPGRSGFLSIISGSSAYSGIFFGDKDSADVGKIRYYHADNSLQFLVNGTTEAIRVLSNGNLLIGSSSATGTASQPLQVTGGAYVSGNLGIGVTSPSYKLDIDNTGGSTATARVVGNDQANVRLRIQNIGSGGRAYEIVGGLNGANNSHLSVYDATAAATRLTITDTGLLGVGTASPIFLTDILSGTPNTGANVNNPSQLSVTGPNKTLIGGGATFFVNSNSDFAIDNGGSIALSGRNTTSSTNSVVWGVVKGAKENATSTNTAGYLAFASQNHNAGALVEAMRINSQQELLVGTATRNANGGILQLISGITFPATAVAASDANTLDDYEEGTFLPTLSGSSGSGLTLSASVDTMKYVKIGKQVTIFGRIQINAVGTAAGNITFSGLPFTVESSTKQSHFCALNVYLHGFTLPTGYLGPVFVELQQSNTSGVIYATKSNDGWSAVQVSNINLTPGAYMYVSGSYTA